MVWKRLSDLICHKMLEIKRVNVFVYVFVRLDDNKL